MTPQEIIDDVRLLINDDHATLPNRLSDAQLLAMVNQLIKRVVLIRPDLFVTTATVTPTADAVAQTLSDRGCSAA